MRVRVNTCHAELLSLFLLRPRRTPTERATRYTRDSPLHQHENRAENEIAFGDLRPVYTVARHQNNNK